LSQQPLPHPVHKVRVFFPVDPVTQSSQREGLARWARPNEIEAVQGKRKRIALVERIAAVPGLWLDIHACYLETGALQALRCSPGAAK